jgi:hypothetical protein
VTQHQRHERHGDPDRLQGLTGNRSRPTVDGADAGTSSRVPPVPGDLSPGDFEETRTRSGETGGGCASDRQPCPEVTTGQDRVIFVNDDGRMTAVAIRSSALAVCVLFSQPVAPGSTITTSCPRR